MTFNASSPSPTVALAELGRISLAESNLGQVLDRVSELAKGTVAGAAEVSITLLGDRPQTAAYTGDLALRLDQHQYEVGYGPSLDAAQAGATRHVSDMTTEDRWPMFSRHAMEHGVFSSLSVALPISQTAPGGLNLYGISPGAFDEHSISVAQAFASYASVTVANAHAYANSQAVAKQMQDAMASRAVIEQAKGILMAQTGFDAEEAFGLLSMRSQNSNRKVRDIAQGIVDGAVVRSAPKPRRHRRGVG